LDRRRSGADLPIGAAVEALFEDHPEGYRWCSGSSFSPKSVPIDDGIAGAT